MQGTGDTSPHMNCKLESQFAAQLFSDNVDTVIVMSNDQNPVEEMSLDP